MSGWSEAEFNAVMGRFHEMSPVLSVKPLPKAKGRIVIPKAMNKGEASYAAHLGLEKRIGEVIWYEYEAITLKLAADVRYTPDFLVLRVDGQLECHEVKGPKVFKRKDGSLIRHGAFVEEDARIKIEVAAAKFPFRFLMVWPGTNGEWDSREY